MREFEIRATHCAKVYGRILDAGYWILDAGCCLNCDFFDRCDCMIDRLNYSLNMPT